MNCFLDLKLILKDNEIQTTVYNKPTNSHLYSQADFCHHLPSILRIQKRSGFKNDVTRVGGEGYPKLVTESDMGGGGTCKQ